MTARKRSPRTAGNGWSPARSRSLHDIHARSAGDLLPRLMKELGLDADVWRETLQEDWKELVGPQVARHARPGRFERGTLYVYVTHSIWLSELQRHGHKQILANLQERYGASRIKRLRLQLDPDLDKQA